MARWPRGGVPIRPRCASAMRCAVTAVTVSHSRRAIAAIALRRRCVSPSGAWGAGAGAAGEKIVTAGGPHQSGAAGAVAGAAAVGGVLRARRAAVTAAVGAGAGAWAGAVTTAMAAEARAGGRSFTSVGAEAGARDAAPLLFLLHIPRPYDRTQALAAADRRTGHGRGDDRGCRDFPHARHRGGATRPPGAHLRGLGAGRRARVPRHAVLR